MNTPEVLEFSLKTSNQELNTSGYSWFDLDPSEEGEQWELKPFHNTQLAGWNDTFTLKFSISERISTSVDLEGLRKPVVIFLPQEIYGTEGSIVIGQGGLQLQTQKMSEEQQAEYLNDMPNSLPSSMQQWINAILHNKPMSITMQDGRDLTELMQGFYMANEQGKSIDFPL